MGNMENMEKMERMEMFSGSPTERSHMSHAHCMQNLTECDRPRLHKHLQTLEKDGTFMGGKVERDYGDKLRSSRFFTQVQDRANKETVGERVSRKMTQWQLK